MERIYVTVRARPLTPEDAKTSPWRISSNSISLSTNLASKFEFGTFPFLSTTVDFVSIFITSGLMWYLFADRIFGEHCKTVEVYEARTKDIVGAALRGFNGTWKLFFLLHIFTCHFLTSFMKYLLLQFISKLIVSTYF